MPDTYFLRNHQGKVSGPFSAADLKRMASERKIDLAWEVSMNRVKWCLAGKVKGISTALERVLAENLSTGEQYRSLTRQEVVVLFLDKFVLNNENFKDSFPFLQPIRIWWVKLTLPKDFVITEVTGVGVHHMKYNVGTGEAHEIDQKEAGKNVSDGVKRFNWFVWLSALLAVLWLAWMLHDFATSFSLSWGTIKTILLVGVALAGFIYKTKRSKVFVGYQLDPTAVKRLGEIAGALSVLRTCSHVWIYQVAQNEGKQNWKYNAGDTFKVNKLPMAIFNRTIPNLETNLRVNGITYYSQAIYFLPDKILVIDGNEVNTVPYPQLQIEVDRLEYVESEGHVYNDSKVIAHRWKFINRNGSKDMRFKDNFELPVVSCGILVLGVGETKLKMMTSNPDAPTVAQEKLNRFIRTGIGLDASVVASGVVPTPTIPTATASEVERLEVIPLLKACPFCGEQILAIARKCKHCREMLDAR